MIIPEGDNEAAYFTRLVRNVRAPSIVIDNVRGVPMTLVGRGIQVHQRCQAQVVRDELPDFDQIWCVFDGGDKHPNIVQAKQLGAQNDINIAVSFPSFDVWVLLHLEEITTRPMSSNEAKTRIHNNHLRGFGRNVHIVPFGLLSDGVSDAIARAKHLEAQHHAHGGEPNPSSEVYQLVEEIIEAGVENRLS